MTLEKENEKYFLVREGKEKSQIFNSELEVWVAMKAHKIVWVKK